MGDANFGDSNVKVAVRVRPMNRREKDLNTKCVVEMEGNQTYLYPANLGKDSRYFMFWTLHEIAESRGFENGCIIVGFGRSARMMGAEGEQECGRAVLFNAACCSLRPAVCRGITLLRLTSSLFLCPPLSRKRRRRVNPRSSIAEELLCLEKGENTS